MSAPVPTVPRVPLDAAIEFIRRGWAPVPIPYRTKAPLIKGWQKLRITAAEAPTRFAKREANIGVLLGEPSGGLVDVDLDCAEAIELAPHFLPPTGAVFGRAGKPDSHWLYNVPGIKSLRFESAEDGMLVELRSTGGQTVFPPSTHTSGEPIAWSQFGEPARISQTELSVSVARLASAALLVKHWPVKGSRHSVALALAGALLVRGCEPDSVAEFIRVVADTAGDPEVEDRVAAVRDTHRRLETGGSVTGVHKLAELLGPDITKALTHWLGLQISEERLTNKNCTDAANGERLVRAYGDDVRFAFYRKKWFIWDDKRWVADETAHIERHATRVARDIYREAEEASEDERKQLRAWARQSQMAPRIDAMLKAARSLVPLRKDEPDRNPYLLNAANGTIDLRTGEIRSHSRGDLITRITSLSYDPDASAPNWLAFLDRIMAGNGRLVAYLQRMAGYAATGDISEQAMFLLYGSGANGKSTFVETVADALGDDYTRPTEYRTLLYRDRNDGVRNDLAALHNIRLVTASEVASEKRLDEALVKQLTGGDKITARFLFAEYFDFVPTFKLWLAANYLPVIRGVDEGIWRRIRIVPFDVMIPAKEQNRKLRGLLRGELPGILAWIVAGARAWSESGLAEPDEVTRATAAYREESDRLAEFLSACTEATPGTRVSVATVYFAYEAWSEESGTDAWQKHTFAKAMAARGHRSEVRRLGGKSQRAYDDLALTHDGKRLAEVARRKRGIADGPSESL